jgi:glucuronoarabinoxylan endo-1,4-beta-xylanase
MKFASAILAAILLTMTSQAHAVCTLGDTQQCTVNGEPGIRRCDPETHLFGPCSTDVSDFPKITIDGNSVHQTIDGFGTFNGAVPPYNPQDPNNYQNRQILDLAFSQEKGIGLTILRSQIMPDLHRNPQTWNDAVDPEQVGAMKEAVSRGATKLIGSVWTPPFWMKTNDLEANCKQLSDPDGNPIAACCLDHHRNPILNDSGQPIQPPCPAGALPEGALRLENYQDFADVLSHYAGEYARTNGVNIYSVSIQNEPDSGTWWSSCRWTGAQIASFLADYLSPTFAANHIGAKVIAPETSQWDESEKDSNHDPYMKATYNNPIATARLDIAAAHLYDSDPAMVFQNALTHKKRVWQTEASLNHPVWDLRGALSWATTIHQGLTAAQINAWLWWALIGRGDVAHGISAKTDQNLIALDDPTPGAISESKTFWALGNFSKFIRPGFVRVGTFPTTGVDPSLLTSAYKDPATGQFVIVAINNGTNDLTVKFDAEGVPGWASSSVTPYITSGGDTQNLSPQPTVSLANIVTIPAQSIVSYVSPPANVSLHKPDGMILSTGNIYFTSHDAAGAHVFRTAQTSTPGQEIELYSEGPGNRFGDIVFAKIGGVYYGYFWAMKNTGKSTIKRISLTGSTVATVLTPDLDNIDIVNSRHNLATDGVSLYWQDLSSVKTIPIGGGDIYTLDGTTPNTPTAGVYLNKGNIIYASGTAVRWVPTGGSVVNPEFRTIANANATVTTILPVANGTYWGDRNGAIQLKVGSTISTVQANASLVPTSIGTNGYTAGGALVWTQCTSSTCQTGFDFPAGNWIRPVANNALGAAINSSGSVFWGDDYGVHRLDL